ncbi:hypothetical protein [Streptomyces sp. NPDC091219]|uniref:hypothetical protein n=1 Tax=Streptomyces sp. NPDC091219 TaxID=3155193 RepID=UPI003450AC98
MSQQEPHQPSWASPQQEPEGGAPPPSRSRRAWKIVGLWLLGALGLFILLGVIGQFTGAGKSSNTNDSKATPSAASKPTLSASASSKHPSKASRPVAVKSSATASHPAVSKSPAAPPAGIDLRFSGDIKGIARSATNILPVKKGANYDYSAPDGATQCVMPAEEGAWSAQFAVRMSGVDWEISIGNGASFGSPKPGKYPAVYDADTDGIPNALTFDIASDKAPRSDVLGNGAGKFQYVYGLAADHNNGQAVVTIDHGLTSGTLDAWLSPWLSDTETPLFHVTGHWSCKA